MNTQGSAAFVMACALVFLSLGFPGNVAGQAPPRQAEGPLKEVPGRSPGKPGTPANTAPPRSDAPQPDRKQIPASPGSPASPQLGRWGGESSSEQTRTDLSPPQADELAHPEGGRVAGDALGTHEWNPLRAMKDVEVGTYYYNRGNYKAAVSRFREALEFKPRDAVATFKLAQSLEKSGEPHQARAQYEAYLTILKNGPNAGESRKALQRLKH